MNDNTASAMAEDQRDERVKKEKKHEHSDRSSFDLDELRELAELVNEHGFTDFEFENENIRIRLSRNVPGAAPQQIPVFAPQPAVTAAPSSAPQAEATAAAPDEDEGIFKITSPIVGTFYRAPGPDKGPYVKEGTKVTPETVVCIVEAMKLMNEIQAETTGEVVKVYVENGQPVEFGQPLFGIRQ